MKYIYITIATLGLFFTNSYVASAQISSSAVVRSTSHVHHTTKQPPCDLNCVWHATGQREGTGIEIQWYLRGGRVPAPTGPEFKIRTHIMINGSFSIDKVWVLQQFGKYVYIHDPVLNRGQFLDANGNTAFALGG
jgi:hypothetical protein